MSTTAGPCLSPSVFLEPTPLTCAKDNTPFCLRSRIFWFSTAFPPHFHGKQRQLHYSYVGICSPPQRPEATQTLSCPHANGHESRHVMARPCCYMLLQIPFNAMSVICLALDDTKIWSVLDLHQTGNTVVNACSLISYFLWEHCLKQHGNLFM